MTHIAEYCITDAKSAAAVAKAANLATLYVSRELYRKILHEVRPGWKPEFDGFFITGDGTDAQSLTHSYLIRIEVKK